MKNILYIITSILVLTSCEKEIDLNLDNKSGQIIIEGNVTDAAGPYYVRVTKSVQFTESNQFPPVTNALVVISDNESQVDTLEYDATVFSYKTNHLRGVYGNTYTLRVTVDGNSYSAQSTLPQPVLLDSLREEFQSIRNQEVYSIIPVFTDAAILGNYYRFKLYINGKLRDGYNNFSDNNNNGKVNSRGLNVRVGNDSDQAQLGDTVTIEMQCVDQTVYTYFQALSQISGGGGLSGGGVTPSNPPGNISNDIFGIFSAHTVQAESIVLQ